jgi:thiol-disulfide isomerase/thioredoxin
VAAGAIGIAVVVLLGYLAVALAGARSDVAALRDDVTQLQAGIADTGTRVGDVESQLGDLDVWLTAVLGSSFTDAIPANGDLPPFEDTTNDLAVLAAMTLPTIEGPEYGSGTTVTYRPNDGIARVWLAWAHWCPHCQAELPELATWYEENADRYPGIELVTVSTSIDESRDNPLLPYLEESAFPFPVIIDEDGTQGSHLGATVFPFWVVTDGDGAVLVRLGGELDISQVDAIFTQLADITANS